MTYLLLALSGLVGGFLAGLIGIGGGLIYVFLLTPALQDLGVSQSDLPQFIVANSLFCVFFASTSAVVSLQRQKQVFWKESALVLVGSVFMSIIAFRYIVQSSWFSYDDFNYVLIAILFYMLFVTARGLVRKTKSNNGEEKQVKLAHLLGAGVGGGFIASLSGLGGGVVMIPILNGLLKVEMKKVRSISLTVIAFTAFGLTMYNLCQPVDYAFSVLSQGLIVFPVGFSVVVGGVVGSLLGVKVSSSLKSRAITKIYLVFLCLFILKKFLEIYI